jgi:amino acid transporter
MTAPAQHATDQGPELKRAIGPKLLLFFVIGDMLGTGIYSLTGDVAGEVGGAAWLAFGLAFVVALFTATSYIELVGKYPRAAGAALYTQEAFGSHFLTFIVAFAVMSSGLSSAAAASRSFAGYFQEFLTVPALIVAGLFVLALAAINFRGVAESVKLNVVLTCVETTGLLIIIVIGAAALAGGNGDAGNALEFNAGGNAFGHVMSGAALAFFALVGFEDSVNMVEETSDPQRVFPRALLLGMAITGTLYMIVAFFTTALVPIEVLRASNQDLLEVVRVGAPWFPLILFSAIAMFAVTNSALINMMMASRLLYGMARERIIPPAFGIVHPLRRTPWVAILLTTALTLGLASWGGVRALGGTTALLLLCVFTIVNGAVLVLRAKPAPHSHFRAPTICPVLGVLSCAYLASPWAGRDPEQYRIA